MKKFIIIAVVFSVLIVFFSCGKKYKLPTEVPPTGNLGDTLYLMLNPPWDEAHGYHFSGLTAIYFGHDTYLYIADTGNNRILQMDVAGSTLGEFSIPHPISISQDELMRILVVTGEKKIYRIDLGPSGDRIPRIVFDYDQPNAFIDTSDIAGYMFKMRGLLDTTDRFVSITDIPAYDRSYYVAVSSPVKNNGRILWFWGAGNNSENSDSLFDHKFGVANGDTFINPVVATGNGITTTRNPNFISAYESGGLMHLIVCQDSGSYPVHDMRYQQQYWNLYWVFTYSRMPSETQMLHPGMFDHPMGASMDPHGNFYIVDSGTSRDCGVYKYSKEGDLLKTFCQPDSVDRIFSNPAGITYDIFGDRRTAYVADTGNNRILRFKLSTDLEP